MIGFQTDFILGQVKNPVGRNFFGKSFGVRILRPYFYLIFLTKQPK
jgi:hypothetical protein